MFPVNNKFALIALPGVPNVSGQVLFPLQFDGQLWALSFVPFDIDEGVRESLGTRANTFKDDNLFLLATAPSKTPHVLDEENRALERSVRFLYVALAIEGMRPSHAGLIIQGARLPAPRGFEVRAISDTSRIYSLEGVPAVPFNESHLVCGAQIAANIGKLVDRERPSRLQKGLRPLLSGLEVDYGEERLHAFVRALEAVVKLPVGKGSLEFAMRCSTFAGRSETTRKILKKYTCYETLWST